MKIIWDEIFDASHRIIDAIKQIVNTGTHQDTED